MAPRLCPGLQLARGVRMLEFEGQRLAVIVGRVRDLHDVPHSLSKIDKIQVYVPFIYQRATDDPHPSSLRCFQDPQAAADYCLQLACQQAGGPGQLTPAQHLKQRSPKFVCETETVLALLAAGLRLTFSPHLDRVRGWDVAVLDESGADVGVAVRATSRTVCCLCFLLLCCFLELASMWLFVWTADAGRNPVLAGRVSCSLCRHA